MAVRRIAAVLWLFAVLCRLYANLFVDTLAWLVKEVDLMWTRTLRILTCMLLMALSCGHGVRLYSQQTSDTQSKPRGLTDIEIQTPFVVREIKGTIYSAEQKPLQDATFMIRRGNGIEEGFVTGRDGSFKIVAQPDPLGAVLHPRLHRILRDSAVSSGTYRFKATKGGFHTTVGTIVVSQTAPKDSSIEIQLQPGYQEQHETAPPQKDLHPRDALAGLDANAGNRKLRPYKRSDVDMPVSLSPGTVQTPEFSAMSERYDIIIQVEKPFPFLKMQCMMGVTLGPLDVKDCNSNDPLLQADWTVWDGEQLVDNGSIPDGCAFEDKYIYRSLGSFAGEAGKKYIVQVRFIKDGTALNVANPHLIVIRHGNFW
jgi:hypothetical protein